MVTPALRPISKPEELAKIPVSEPVLVELPAGVDVPPTPGASAEEAPNGVETVGRSDEGADALKKQLSAALEANKLAQTERDRERENALAERQRREAAEAEAQRIREEGRRSTREFFGSAIEGAQAEIEAATTAIQQAFESADGKALADAQLRLSRAATKLSQLESSQADFDAAPPVQQQPTQQHRQPTARTGDIMAQVATDPNLLEREKEWLKSHPELLLDPQLNQELALGYRRAMQKKLTRGSDAYFNYLDSFLEFKQPGAEGGSEDTLAVSAPVTRGSTNANGAPTNQRVTLSPEQRELARSMGLTDVQYARGQLQLDAAKKADPERFRSQ